MRRQCNIRVGFTLQGNVRTPRCCSMPEMQHQGRFHVAGKSCCNMSSVQPFPCNVKPTLMLHPRPFCAYIYSEGLRYTNLNAMAHASARAATIEMAIHTGMFVDVPSGDESATTAMPKNDANAALKFTRPRLRA